MDEYLIQDGRRLWRVSAKVGRRESSRAGFVSKTVATKAAPGLIEQWRVEVTAAKVTEDASSKDD